MNLEKIPGSSLNLWELSFGYNLTRNEFIHAGSPGIEMIEECGETGETLRYPADGRIVVIVRVKGGL